MDKMCSPRPCGGAIPRFVSGATSLAVVAVAFAGVVGAVTAPGNSLSSRRILVVGVLGIVHALLGTAGIYVLERRGTRVHLQIHFVVALAVAIAAVVVSRGFASLMLMSVISQSVLYLPPAIIVAAVGTSAAATFGIYAIESASTWQFARRAVGWTAATVFVIGFSYVLVRQRRMQAELERLASELGDANERLRGYARDAFELATAKERNRIAREIHDGLGHYLTVVHVQLEAALAMLRRDPDRAEQSVVKAQQLSHEGLAEVRRSVAVLRGSSSDPTSASLVGTIEKLAAECSIQGLIVRVVIDGAPRPLPDPIAWTVYRTAQEGLTNVRRHARASSACIRLEFRASSWVRLRIEDDGIGDAPAREGFGLVGLRERAELVGGKVSSGMAPGGGFALDVELPG